MLFSVVLMAASVHGSYDENHKFVLREPGNPDNILVYSTQEAVWLRCSNPKCEARHNGVGTPYDLRFMGQPKDNKQVDAHAYILYDEAGLEKSRIWFVLKSDEQRLLEQCVVRCKLCHDVHKNRSSLFRWTQD